MTHAIRALLPSVPHPQGSYGSLQEARDAVDEWIARHVHNGASLVLLAGVHIVCAGKVVWKAR